jgi:hypothetical protein
MIIIITTIIFKRNTKKEWALYAMPAAIQKEINIYIYIYIYIHILNRCALINNGNNNSYCYDFGV